MNISNKLYGFRSLHSMKMISMSLNPLNRKWNGIYFLTKRKSSSTTMMMASNSIANSQIVRYSMDCLISLHEWSHLPWFLEISMVTILARAIIAFPLTVLQRKILLRYAALKPEIELMSKNVKRKIKEEAYYMGWNANKTKRLYTKTITQEINRLIERDNCHPFKASLVVMFQIPLWIILSNSYRNLATMFPNPQDLKLQIAHEQLKREGFLWFPDLTIPDPTGLLPIINCIINLTIIQILVNERRRNNIKDSKLIKIFTNGGRIFSLILVPIGLTMPADLTFYWFISSSFGLVQNILLINPRMMKILKLEPKKG